MANTKISQLTATTSPTGNEELVYAYNNANGKMTLNTMKTFAGTGKQDTLVSGTNIKTINNTSLLGSGNIDIQGGGSSDTLEIQMKARTSLEEGDAVRASFKYENGGYVSYAQKMASRSLSLTDVVNIDGYTIAQESQGSTGLKTINVGYNKQLSVFYSNNKLALCLSDEQLDNKRFYYTNYNADEFDIASPRRGYAVVIFCDRSAGGNQYPKVFAVDCTAENDYGLTVGTTYTLESIAATGNKRVGICQVEDSVNSNTVAAIWSRYYREGSTDENGQTMYSILTLDPSTLNLTVGVVSVFCGNVNDCTQVPFGYLGNGYVGFVNETQTLSGSTVTSTDWIVVMRRYSGGTFGSMMYETLSDTAKGGPFLSGEPHQIFGVNGYVFVRMGAYVFVCGRFPDCYIKYSFHDLWTGSGAVRYYPVDGGKHLLKVDMSRDDDNVRGKIRITKYEVGTSALHEIAYREYNTGSDLINGSYPMPQITEIGNRNLWIQNERDGDYYLSYISNAGELVIGNTNTHAGEVIGIVKDDVAAGEMATIIVAGIAPGEVNEPGEKIHLQPNGKLAGYRTDYPMGIGVEVGNPGKVLLNNPLLPSHNYLSVNS